MKINLRKIRGESGFTIVEMVTTLFIFSLTMVFFSGAYIGSLNIQRRALNIQQAEENVNFLLEAMAKEIRVSVLDPSNPDNNCPALPSSYLDLTHPINGSIRYYLSGNNLHRVVNGVDTIVNGNTIEFSRLSFCIKGNSTEDDYQPRVSIIGGVRSKKASSQAIIDFQTTLSPRYLQD
jgi:type II secretory pathway pseudopilin PulG